MQISDNFGKIMHQNIYKYPRVYSLKLQFKKKIKNFSVNKIKIKFNLNKTLLRNLFM